ELLLFAKLRKHIYLIEWRVEPDNIVGFSSSTYTKYATSIFITCGLKKDPYYDEDANRFSAIGSKMDTGNEDMIVEYHVLKRKGSQALVSDKLKYNISNWL